MKNRNLLFALLSIISGLLFYISWTPMPVWFALFLAFVPLLWIENEVVKNNFKKSKLTVFLYSYLSFLIWNVSTTWWVGNTTVPASGILANTINAFLMCIPFLLFHVTHKRIRNRWAYVSLPLYWLSFEFLHLRWELSWPWLTLGNAFANFPRYIQWYEYTGTLGGSLWILVANILLFNFYQKLFSDNTDKTNTFKKINTNLLLALVSWIAIPLTLSIYIYNTISIDSLGKINKKNIVVVQPNIDPYLEKFDRETLDKQIQTLISLSLKKINQETDYLVWPETAIPQGIVETEFEVNETLLNIRTFLLEYPRLKLITGISGYMRYDSAVTSTARNYSDGSCCYDSYNSAIQMEGVGKFKVYHKSKLVPGVEAMPYPWLFKFLEPLSENMEGISGSLGKQDYRTVFYSFDSTGVAPVICYESIYGEYVTEYVRNGAHMIFIITNDAWWGNTAGHEQHLHYASLRSIETRRVIARSANTGISAYIDIKGNIYQPTAYDTPDVIASSLYITNYISFYVKHGDYIGRIAIFFSFLCIIYIIFKNRFNGLAKNRE
jgi:apolipoprotein N-acyltransferase